VKYRVIHKTTYYGHEPVSIGHNKAWLEPRPVPHQQLDSFSLKIEPEPSVRNHQVDYYGNPVTLFSFNEGYLKLNVTATSFLTVSPAGNPANPETPVTPLAWEDVRELIRGHSTPESLQAFEFVFPSSRAIWSSEMRDYALQSFTSRRPILSALQELTERIHKDFVYDSKATSVTTPVLDVFRVRRGVCQDFAHLQVAMLRSIGMAARYVSGYLRTYPPAGKPRLIGADASHAWLSVYCGPADHWVEVDPTNNRFCSTDHITLAWGRDYSDVPPLTGVFIGGGQHRLSVEVDVMPLI
jgi:transglutaminase-like putative cysteine protease